MSQYNPLQKYFRQPKVFLNLPSKGLYYESGTLTGDYNSVPVFAMSGMDEIIFKTPDALFSGEATIRVIESCVPYIKKAGKIPSIDIDSIIIAIRIATYGETLSLEKECENCGSDNNYDIQLPKILDHLSTLKFENQIKLNNDISLKIRPLNYSETSHYSMENFKLQKKLMQIADLSVEDQQKTLDEIYKDLADLQLDFFLSSIESVQLTDETIVDKQLISDWLKNSERDLFSTLKEKIESNKDQWQIPPQPTVCGSCNHKSNLEILLDQSSFFA